MKHFLLIFVCFPLLSVFAQSITDFEKDFNNALNPKFTESDLNYMFRTYESLLAPHDAVTSLMSNLKGKKVEHYPLIHFRNSGSYKNNIHKLVKSHNRYQRILAYLVIASSGDSSFENTLLEKIRTEKEHGNLVWAGMALLYLKSNQTTALFDYLVNNEDFGDAHMIPLFYQLNKDSLQSTAYSRINSNDITSKILAAQVLSVTGLNPKTETLLKEAVKNWEFNIKGYAIYSIKTLGIGNILEIMKPLLDSASTREIALEALANSPAKEDQDYLLTLVDKSDSVSEELLGCFFSSHRIENVKTWLKLLYTKKLPQDIFISVNLQPILLSDDILHDLQTALEKTDNIKVLQNLVGALRGRSDDKSIQIVMSLLNHSDETVRYWAASALKGSKSDMVKTIIPKLLMDPNTRTGSMVELAIENGVDTLQAVFEKILSGSPSLDWERSSIQYLSEFPLERDKNIFRNILKNNDDSFIKTDAAYGLARLKDTASVDLIIKIAKRESKGSEINVRPYLEALGMMKGKKAKAAIIKYKNSKEILVRELAADLLKNW